MQQPLIHNVTRSASVVYYRRGQNAWRGRSPPHPVAESEKVVLTATGPETLVTHELKSNAGGMQFASAII
jgi:hypothetical protein